MLCMILHYFLQLAISDWIIGDFTIHFEEIIKQSTSNTQGFQLVIDEKKEKEETKDSNLQEIIQICSKFWTNRKSLTKGD